MALNLQQIQKQTQRLIMTPQMQQSIQLLQLNSIELEQMTEQELMENPFLAVTEEAEEAERNGEKTEEKPKERETETEDSDQGEDAPQEEPEKFEEVDLNWDDYFSETSNAASYTYSGSGSDEEERDFSEYTASRTSLADHLQWQLRCSVLEDQDYEIGEYLIGSLNGDGYLPEDIVEETAREFKVKPAKVESILEVLQEFEPVGIFARSLAESLLLQMKNLGSYSDLARQVLEDHMDLFQKKKFREIGRKLGVDEAAILDIFHKIQRLEPHPGRSITSDSVQYIKPDVFVKMIDGELMIYLNEGQSGRLSVDRFYRRMLRQHRKALTQKEREYAIEKYRSAISLIKNIEKRKSTILNVTQAIMEVQRGFLEKGVEALKPLTLREVADMVGMHESTVARVTSRKYVETPQGTYPLKYFFSSSIDSHGAEAVSSRAIKEKLHQLIDAEDPRKPLSDQKIAEKLREQGFDIARRTVAKYREQLKILPAKYRRET